MAEHPYAALLWLEFQASPEGQKVLEDHWSLSGFRLYTGRGNRKGNERQKTFRGRLESSR